MSYAVFGDWLAQCVDQCTCYGGEFGHEPGCGYEPVAKITEIEAALGAVERVRELHQRGIWTATGRFYCKHCRNREVEWPCPTVAALDLEHDGRVA